MTITNYSSPPRATWRTLCLLFLALPGCSGSDQDHSFTQLDGFAEIRKLQSHSLPTAAEQALLEKYRPRLFIAAGEEGPLDFYADYITQGCLQIADQPPDCKVDQAKLNAVKADPVATFTHLPEVKPVTPVGYGSIYRAPVELDGLTPVQRNWTFLRYHYAFRSSGIAVGVKNIEAFLMDLVGDLKDWHQLDHYTAVVIVLNENERPVLVMLQQHNYMHTYLIGQDPAFPATGPALVDVAMRSNEMYPHRPEPTMHRAASFLSGATAAWLAGTSDDKPMLGTFDGTYPDQEIDYELTYLRPDDAFYVFEGRLGEKRSLPGRDGPPGALYYTLPDLWHYEKSMPMFYWLEPDLEFTALFDDVEFNNYLAPLPAQRRRLVAAMLEAGLVQ